MFYKVNNLVQENGTCDYKGLNIDLFVSGTQIYPVNFTQINYCVIETTENEIVTHSDLTILSSEEYELTKNELLEFNKQYAPITKTDIVEKQVADLQYTLMMNGVI